MESILVDLKMAEPVKSFVNVTQKYDYDIDLRSGRFIVDAKSILGIFSLDLSKPLAMEVYGGDYRNLLDELKGYIVE